MNTTEAWSKITGTKDLKMGKIAVVPLYDGENWMYVRAISTRQEGHRQSVVALMDHFPETVPQLEKLGIRVKALLKRPITTNEQVEAWNQSIFNVGPSAAQLTPKAIKSDTQPPVASNGSGPVRPRGRPRKDGLIPGSPEAKAADEVKKAQKAEERAAKLKAKGYAAVVPPDELPEDTVVRLPKRRLVRIRVEQSA